MFGVGRPVAVEVAFGPEDHVDVGVIAAVAIGRAGPDLEQNSFDFWTQTDGQYVYPPALAIALLPLTILDIGKGGPIWLLILTLAALSCHPLSVVTGLFYD